MCSVIPISGCSRWSEPHRCGMPGEHTGERTTEPCVRPHMERRMSALVRLATQRTATNSVRLCELRATFRMLGGGVVCRRTSRYLAQNKESGRERPLRKSFATAWPSAKRGRSRPDPSLNLPHKAGCRRPRSLPHSPAPDTDINVRLTQPRAMSIAAEGGPAAWH